MIYPEPLYGGAPERDLQIRQYLFRLTDYINRLTARVDDIEGTSDGGGGGSSAVTSVNGQTGAVVLDAADVGAKPSTYTAPVSSVNGQTGAVSLGASDVHALPDSTVIPAAVTEQTVSGWGFTKNTGTYSKPSGGIPDSDIASAADWNAKGTYSKPSGGIPKSDLASAVQESLGKADTALQEIADVIYDIPAEFHADTADHHFTFAGGINSSTILSALNEGKLPVVQNSYGSLKRKWFYADYNDDGSDVYIQFFRQTQFGLEVMLYTESDGKAYVASTSLSSQARCGLGSTGCLARASGFEHKHLGKSRVAID